MRVGFNLLVLSCSACIDTPPTTVKLLLEEYCAVIINSKLQIEFNAIFLLNEHTC